MSWLDRRRPPRAKFRTFQEKRACAELQLVKFRAAMLRIPVRQYCNEPVASEDEQPCGLDAGHAGDCKVLYYMPLPSGEQLIAQGFTFAGASK